MIQIGTRDKKIIKSFAISAAVISLFFVFSALCLSSAQKAEEMFHSREYTNVFLTADGDGITAYADKKLLSIKYKSLSWTVQNTVFVIPGIISPLFFLIDNLPYKW